jgi:hypothetical protein
MIPLLINLALQAGMPSIRAILERKLGDAGGGLAADVIGTIAARAGVKPDELEAVATESPGKIIDAMRQVEPMTPELIALYTKGLEQQFTLLQAEMAEGGWKAAWRPAGMWFLLFLWFWQVIGLHVLNAIFRIALPPMPWDQLIYFSGLYMGLYMGGHTLKALASKSSGAGK